MYLVAGQQFRHYVADLSAVSFAFELRHELRHHFAFVARSPGSDCVNCLPRRREDVLTAHLLGKIAHEDSQFCFLPFHQIRTIPLPECFDALSTTLRFPCNDLEYPVIVGGLLLGDLGILYLGQHESQRSNLGSPLLLERLFEGFLKCVLQRHLMAI